MNTHYVCSECGSVSKIASTCQNDDCVREGLPLAACNCEDGKHDGIVNSWNAGETNIEEESSGQSQQTIDLDNESALM